MRESHSFFFSFFNNKRADQPLSPPETIIPPRGRARTYEETDRIRIEGAESPRKQIDKNPTVPRKQACNGNRTARTVKSQLFMRLRKRGDVLALYPMMENVSN